MNRARMVKLLREAADEIERQLEADAAAPLPFPDALAKVHVKAITDIEKARARKALRRLGVKA